MTHTHRHTHRQTDIRDLICLLIIITCRLVAIRPLGLDYNESLLTPPETVSNTRVDGNRRVAESPSTIQLVRERLRRSFDETSDVNRADSRLYYNPSRPVTGSGRWQRGGRYIIAIGIPLLSCIPAEKY